MTSERSLVTRFARSAPTQATAIDDTSVELLCVRDGHTGVGVDQPLDDEGLRRGRAARPRRRRGRCAQRPRRPYPGPARGRPPARAHDGFDAATAELDPADAGAALRAAFAACAGAAGLEAFGIWTAGEVRTAIASSTGVALTDAVTDAHMKVIARDERGRSGYAAATAVAAAAIDAGRARRRRGGEGRARAPAGRA